MAMRLLVLNRKRAQEFRGDEPYVMISVVDVKDEESNPVKLRDDPRRKAVLRLAFDDVDRGDMGLVLMSKEQAAEILSFAATHQEVPLFVVHCGAGISRSAGIAAALNDLYCDKRYDFFNSRGMYLPNRHVYRTILEVAERRA